MLWDRCVGVWEGGACCGTGEGVWGGEDGGAVGQVCGRVRGVALHDSDPKLPTGTPTPHSAPPPPPLQGAQAHSCPVHTPAPHFTLCSPPPPPGSSSARVTLAALSRRRMQPVHTTGRQSRCWGPTQGSTSGRVSGEGRGGTFYCEAINKMLLGPDAGFIFRDSGCS